MLSHLARTAARALTVWREGECLSEYNEENVLYLDVDELSQLVHPSLLNIPWNGVSGVCSRAIMPMYRIIRDTLDSDVNHLAHIFAELDADLDERGVDIHDSSAEDAALFLRDTTQHGPDTSLVRPARKRRRSSVQDIHYPLTIPSSHPSIPTIIITPCPTLPRDPSCGVPYQDASFGNKLCVPTYPVVNDVFPPLLAKPSPPVENWRFVDGHWHALLPSVEEQMSKGMFSRPIPARRQRTFNPSSPLSRTRRSSARSV